ncbi:MAG: long-chain fatty acid--CoA ligase [Proteobacteria bacterium]|nr:long-chain fatty acid--CoA ligase [Pseudomonadota bacterium]
MSLSLGALAEASLERLGDHRSLEFESTWHTAAELHDRAVRLSGGFAGLGVRPGDRVVVCMTNCPEVLLAYQAIWRAGAVATPVISAVTPAELRHILRDAEAVAAIVSPASLPLALAAGADVRLVLAGEELLPGADVLLGELEQEAPGPVVGRADDDLAALLYTGGTTGRSKGVALTHAGLDAAGAAAHAVAYSPGRNRGLLPLPLAHVYGLMVSVSGLHAVEQGRGEGAVQQEAGQGEEQDDTRGPDVRQQDPQPAHVVAAAVGRGV